MVPSVPSKLSIISLNPVSDTLQVISIFTFYSTHHIRILVSELSADLDTAARYKQHRRMQFLLFLLSSVAGPRMIYLINRGSWLVNIKQVLSARSCSCGMHLRI